MYKITARPWGLPGLATSVRASQDDDDDGDGDDDDDDDGDGDDYYVFFYYYFFLISSWNPERNPNDCMLSCSMGPGDFDIFLKPYKKP